MPKIQQYHKTAVRRIDPYDSPMAVRLVGFRHYEIVPNSGATAEVPGSGHRLLHEIGGNRYGEKHEKLHLEIHHMQVWDP